MIGILKNFFNNGPVNECAGSKINQPHKLHVATCAILLEMAKVDGEFSESERNNIVAIFQDNYKLTAEEISSLIETSEKELEKSIDLWHFTKQVDKNYTPVEKINIIETIWQVAYADGKLDKHEDYLIHKLSELLNIPHKHMIEAKMKVLNCSPVKNT
jgi:uncharacterized tellurite resistance protein B-like protein